MPSMITGKPVRKGIQIGPDELQLLFSDASERASWKREQSVFGKARALGFNTALVGWYHPYCRILSSDLTRCFWREMPMIHNSMGSRISELMPNQIRSLFETSLLSPFGQSLTTIHAIRNHQEMVDEALSIAGDPSIGLALFHFQIPHSPHGYNRHTGRFELANSPVSGYLDSLALADRTLGSVLETVKKQGLSWKTLLLISSDHSYRSAWALGEKPDRRVPFLLSLPGQTRGLEFREPFNTILTHDLLLALLHREVSSEDDAREWLAKMAQTFEVRP